MSKELADIRRQRLVDNERDRDAVEQRVRDRYEFWDRDLAFKKHNPGFDPTRYPGWWWNGEK